MKRYKFDLLVAMITFLMLSIAALVAMAQAPSGPSTGTGYPAGALAVTSSATGTTGAVVATLPGQQGRLTYICGAYATGNEAATGAIVAVTIAGTVSGSLSTFISHPVTPALGTLFLPDLTPCIPASAINTAITVTSAADAAGTNVSVSAWGYTVPAF